MIDDLAHGGTALLVIDVQREYFDPEGPPTCPRASMRRPHDELLLRDDRSRRARTRRRGAPRQRCERRARPAAQRRHIAPHADVLQNTSAALAAGFAEIVTADELVARLR